MGSCPLLRLLLVIQVDIFRTPDGIGSVGQHTDFISKQPIRHRAWCCLQPNGIETALAARITRVASLAATRDGKTHFSMSSSSPLSSFFGYENFIETDVTSRHFHDGVRSTSGSSDIFSTFGGTLLDRIEVFQTYEIF